MEKQSKTETKGQVTKLIRLDRSWRLTAETDEGGEEKQEEERNVFRTEMLE